ncbi:hypothetical protein D3C78_07110 [compost metagenome]
MGVQRQIELLAMKQGSREGCLSTMRAPLSSFALLSHFRDGSLSEMKQWSYLAAKIHSMALHESLAKILVVDLLWPLISDNEEIIDWYRQFDAPYWPDNPKITGRDKRNPKDWMYYRYQSWLALNQRWEELAERCERILFKQDEIKKDRMYLIDHRFYLALSRGDIPGMENVLTEMCQPRMLALRHKQESGLTNKFIASHATIFAKMAWRNGYEVNVDTPWIPKEWLPIKPNKSYEDPWPFMQKFDIWQPFKQPWTDRSPIRSE